MPCVVDLARVVRWHVGAWRPAREHEDLEIAVPTADVRLLRATLPCWCASQADCVVVPMARQGRMAACTAAEADVS